MKNEQDRSRDHDPTSAVVKKYRKQIVITLILCLISIGVIAGATVAWFASNRNVSAANANITSETPSASLYIAKGETSDKKYYTFTTASAPENSGLYPISTVDCKAWYYVTGWTPEEQPDGSLIPKASSYTLVANPAENGMAVTYTNADKTHVAYYKQPFTIYTDRDSLEVYLAGLTVTTNAGAQITQDTPEARLQSGLRVAVTDKDNNLLLYYAPNAETDTGNSKGALTGKFTGINGTGETNIQEIATAVSDLAGLLAQQDSTDSSKYTVTDNTIHFGEATTDGLVLNTYVWLEGTDAETLGHITGGITNPLSVTFTFVGVEP